VKCNRCVRCCPFFKVTCYQVHHNFILDQGKNILVHFIFIQNTENELSDVARQCQCHSHTHRFTPPPSSFSQRASIHRHPDLPAIIITEYNNKKKNSESAARAPSSSPAEAPATAHSSLSPEKERRGELFHCHLPSDPSEIGTGGHGDPARARRAPARPPLPPVRPHRQHHPGNPPPPLARRAPARFVSHFGRSR
jgi:hypothetical protein